MGSRHLTAHARGERHKLSLRGPPLFACHSYDLMMSVVASWPASSRRLSRGDGESDPAGRDVDNPGTIFTVGFTSSGNLAIVR